MLLALSLLRRLLLLVAGRVLVVLSTVLLLALWLLLGNLHHDVSGLANNLSLEAFLGISSVLDGADETVTVDYRVAALDNTIVTALLAVLVVGELIVLNVKSELVRSVVL